MNTGRIKANLSRKWSIVEAEIKMHYAVSLDDDSLAREGGNNKVLSAFISCSLLTFS